MCIIGCSPKRAGYVFLKNLNENKLNTPENIRIKALDIPFLDIISKNSIIFNNGFNNEFKDEQTRLKIKQYARKLGSIRIPKNYIFQGSLLMCKYADEYWEKIEKSFAAGIYHFSEGNLRMLSRFSKGNNQMRLILAYSKDGNIKSYLFGDDNFSIPHWFISKKLDGFNQESIDKTLKIFKVRNLNQAKKIIKSRIKKTPCIFCSEKILKRVNKFYLSTFPEICWCNDRVK